MKDSLRKNLGGNTMEHSQSIISACNDALEEMTEIYHSKDQPVLTWEPIGKRVIGCLGNDVPEEIFTAAGYIPVSVFGKSGIETPIADRYLELAFEPGAKSQFERIADGTYQYLDRLVISNSSDVLVRLFYYMRQISRVEPEVHLPPIYFFDFKFSRFRSSTLYNRDRLRDLIDAVEPWSGPRISMQSLQEAIALHNENRGLLREMNRYRISDTIRVSGVQAMKMIGAAMLVSKEKHNRLMKTFLSGIEAAPKMNGVRIFLSGSAHENTGFYELAESCDAIIVGEAHDLGSRCFMGPEMDISDPLASVCDFYHLRLPGSKKALPSERAKAMISQVDETGARAVIFYIREFDDAASWDYPIQRKALEAKGIPSLLLREQPYRMNNTQELREKISQFIQSVANQAERSM